MHRVVLTSSEEAKATSTGDCGSELCSRGKRHRRRQDGGFDVWWCIIVSSGPGEMEQVYNLLRSLVRLVLMGCILEDVGDVVGDRKLLSWIPSDLNFYSEGRGQTPRSSRYHRDSIT